MKQLRLALLIIAFVASVKGLAQTTIKGHVVNEQGKAIEYVSSASMRIALALYPMHKGTSR